MNLKRLIVIAGCSLALAVGAVPFAASQVEAGDLYVEGGGGGGGAGNSGTMATGGGGSGAYIGASGSNLPGGAGQNSGSSSGGTGGAGGTGGQAGGAGGTGNNALSSGGTATNGANQNAGNGGAGGSAAAGASDMAATGVTTSTTIRIHGGNGGNGGQGLDTGFNSGFVGGSGGAGGSASLNWLTGGAAQSIGILDVLAGTNGTGALGWTDNSTTPPTLHGSGGGHGGHASFFLDADLTVSSLVSVRARDNYATYESNSLTANSVTVMASDYLASMKVHGNADLGTLDVVSGGAGEASFKADQSGIVTTSGNVLVRTNSTGNATFNSVQYFGGGTTDVLATGAGSASMNVSTAGSNLVNSVNTMTIDSISSGNASFSAPLAGTVKITGANQDLNVTTSGGGGGKASFSAPMATVSVASGNLTVDSGGTTNANGTANFLARNLNIGATTLVRSGVAAASAEITGTQVTLADLTVTAGNGNAGFSANTTNLLHTNAINVNGTGGTSGNASISAVNAMIDTSNDNVTISTAGTAGGTKGIYASRLETGNEQTIQINNGIVTMTGTGTGNSSAQLVLSDSLQTRELNLSGNGTANSVITNINNVDVTVIDTTFNFTNTVASSDSGASGVYFKTIELGDRANVDVRTLTANAGLGTYWADNLDVNVTSTPGAGQNWVGNIWLGGQPGTPLTASGSVGTVNMLLPANVNLNDYVGNGSGANPNYMLAVDGQITLEDGAAINLRAAQGNPFKGLDNNAQLQMISSDQAVIDNTTAGVPVEGYAAQGAKVYLFDMALSADGQSLLAEYMGTANIAKAYLEAGVAAFTTINQGFDLEVRTMNNTFNPYINKGQFKDGVGAGVMFGAEYSHTSYDSGSEVTTDNFNVVLGPAYRTKGALGMLGVTAFFEGGYGDFDTTNNFSGIDVLGGGNVRYFGGGVGARNDFSCGFYMDASMRMGMVDFDQTINTFGSDTGNYDVSTAYYGAHLGIGKVFELTEAGRLDIYARGLFLQISGKDTDTSAGELLSIDNITSMRSQLGARYNHKLTDSVSGYVGAIWDYEFDGEVSGKLDGDAIDEPSLKGSTGIAELGIQLTPSDRFTLDLGVQGSVGKREGIGGTAMLTLSF